MAASTSTALEGEGEVVGGEIIDLIPGSTLECHWRFTGEPDSIIRFDLEAVDTDKTKLRLDHRHLPPDQAWDTAPGGTHILTSSIILPVQHHSTGPSDSRC